MRSVSEHMMHIHVPGVTADASSINCMSRDNGRVNTCANSTAATHVHTIVSMSVRRSDAYDVDVDVDVSVMMDHVEGNGDVSVRRATVHVASAWVKDVSVDVRV